MKVTIADLKKKSDEELSALLGYDTKLETFKKNIEEADGLSGKAREIVEKRVAEMFTPHVYPDDLTYTIESAKRKVDPKAAKCDCSPCSVLD